MSISALIFRIFKRRRYIRVKMSDVKDSGARSWGSRHTLIVVSFLMCMLCYSLRFNLSIAIVAMVDESSNSKLTTNHHEPMCPSLVSNNSGVPTKRGDVNTESEPNTVTFQWTEADQGLILGSFFWGYVISQFPGGLLAQKVGAKWIIGFGMLWTGILSLFIPYAVTTGGRDFLILIRILQGIGEGAVIPSISVLLAKWTPPHERARLAAICFSGLPFGTAVTMILSGHLITAYGWPAVFYVPGILTIVWFFMWSMCVYSSPEKHPTISKSELKYLEDTIGAGKTEECVHMSDVPWKKILASVPFWAIFISQFCNAWGHNMLKSEGPKYLHSALHFNIHENSYLSATPYLCQWFFCILTGRICDFMIENNRISLLNARKVCNSIGQWGTALTFAGIVLAGCDRTLAVVCFMMSGMMNGAMLCGSIINPIDIAPNYVGAIEGVINSVANVAGFGAPYVAGLLLDHEHSIVGWRYVFFIPVISNLIGNTVFLLGASAKIQPWNNIEKKRRDNRFA